VCRFGCRTKCAGSEGSVGYVESTQCVYLGAGHRVQDASCRAQGAGLRSKILKP
jgi:hypothetical protein